MTEIVLRLCATSV